MKTIVGLMPLWDDEKESLWMLPGYMDGVAEAGATPIVLPFTEDRDEISQLLSMCDGLLFTGGHDVSPALYREEPIEGVIPCEKRDKMEKIFLEMAIESKKPVLGICRGIQFINAALGGTLYQDLPSQRPSEVEHHQTPPYDVPVHDVILKEDTPIRTCLGCDRIAVNSYHHQAVKALSPELSVMAQAEDGLVEAVYMPSHPFLWAVQWHPEFSHRTDENSKKIFRAFVDAMRKR